MAASAERKHEMGEPTPVVKIPPLTTFKKDQLVDLYKSLNGDFAEWLKKGESDRSYELAEVIIHQRQTAHLLGQGGNAAGCLPGIGPLLDVLLNEMAYQVQQDDPLQRLIRTEKARELFEIDLRIYPHDGPIQDPVVLDLRGSGRIDTLDVNSGLYCDYYGNGFAIATGWVSPDAGILVTDRNGNGVIDDGSELFGSLTPLPNGEPAADGFQALADLDSSHDGKIDAQDPAYSQLLVWADPSGDGNWQQGVVFTLPELGIESIDLKIGVKSGFVAFKNRGQVWLCGIYVLRIPSTPYLNH
ncbi:MAG: hypothetical protein V1792_25605 [Pseudomonadota bacterium]